VVSFESRRKKRRYKAAVKRSKRAPETASRWFLTFARENCRCASCGDRLKWKGEIVYRHEPREIRCVACAGREPDSRGFRPSLRWERANRAGSRRPKARSIDVDTTPRKENH
jgi:hypothetical protein